jgi:hypothetical protein
MPGRFLLAVISAHADRGQRPHANVIRVRTAAIYRAEGTLGTDAEKGREAVRESLTPAEADRRNGVRNGVFSDGSDDLAVWKRLSYPTFTVWNVAEKPSVALRIVGLSRRLAISDKVRLP